MTRSDTGERTPLRVLLAVGNPERERRLRDALSAAGVAIAGRCLDGPSLADRASGLDFDVALASSDLHRLSAATLSAIREARLPVVLLARAGDVDRLNGLAHLLPADADPAEIARALNEAWSRGANYPVAPAQVAAARHDDAGPGPSAAGDGPGNVVAVVSGKGAPGVTTVAIALAAALGERRRRAALVDADLRGGNVAAYLDLDPRRGLLALVYGADSGSLGIRLDDELQDAPGFSALAGIERSESRSQISSELMSGVLAVLRSRYEYVVADLGEVIPGVSSPAGDTVLRSNGAVLLVTRGDLVSLWNARACLRHLQEGLGLPTEGIGIVLNRREKRDQYRHSDVERALGAPVLGVVPEDRRAALAAIERQLPLTAASGPAARELRSLAARLIGEASAVSAAATPAVRRRLRAAPVERA